jgi:hypothetical protein
VIGDGPLPRADAYDAVDPDTGDPRTVWLCRAAVVRQTDKAALVRHDGDEWWVPKAVFGRVRDRGGYIDVEVVERWARDNAVI